MIDQPNDMLKFDIYFILFPYTKLGFAIVKTTQVIINLYQ